MTASSPLSITLKFLQTAPWEIIDGDPCLYIPRIDSGLCQIAGGRQALVSLLEGKSVNYELRPDETPGDAWLVINKRDLFKLGMSYENINKRQEPAIYP